MSQACYRDVNQTFKDKSVIESHRTEFMTSLWTAVMSNPEAPVEADKATIEYLKSEQPQHADLNWFQLDDDNAIGIQDNKLFAKQVRLKNQDGFFTLLREGPQDDFTIIARDCTEEHFKTPIRHFNQSGC